LPSKTSIEQLESKIELFLEEFLSSADCDEAYECLEELKSPEVYIIIINQIAWIVL
jgi:hypothetical protein